MGSVLKPTPCRALRPQRKLLVCCELKLFKPAPEIFSVRFRPAPRRSGQDLPSERAAGPPTPAGPGRSFATLGFAPKPRSIGSGLRCNTCAATSTASCHLPASGAATARWSTRLDRTRSGGRSATCRVKTLDFDALAAHAGHHEPNHLVAFLHDFNVRTGRARRDHRKRRVQVRCFRSRRAGGGRRAKRLRIQHLLALKKRFHEVGFVGTGRTGCSTSFVSFSARAERLRLSVMRWFSSESVGTPGIGFVSP